MKMLLIATLALTQTATSALADEVNNDDAQTLNAGFVALRSGDFQGAVARADTIITKFESSKELDSDYACTSGGADTLATLLGAAVAFDKGTAEKSKRVAVSSAICDAYFLKGFALIDLKLRNEALPNLETAVAMDPDNQHYANELAEWYKSGRDWQKSLELFTLASEKTDLSIEMMDDKKEAKRITNQTRCRSYRGIAFNHVELEQWTEAKDALKKCLALIPNDPKSKGELEYIKSKTKK